MVIAVLPDIFSLLLRLSFYTDVMVEIYIIKSFKYQFLFQKFIGTFGVFLRILKFWLNSKFYTLLYFKYKILVILQRLRGPDYKVEKSRHRLMSHISESLYRYNLPPTDCYDSHIIYSVLFINERISKKPLL